NDDDNRKTDRDVLENIEPLVKVNHAIDRHATRKRPHSEGYHAEPTNRGAHELQAAAAVRMTRNQTQVQSRDEPMKASPEHHTPPRMMTSNKGRLTNVCHQPAAENEDS